MSSSMVALLVCGGVVLVGGLLSGVAYVFAVSANRRPTPVVQVDLAELLADYARGPEAVVEQYRGHELEFTGHVRELITLTPGESYAYVTAREDDRPIGAKATKVWISDLAVLAKVKSLPKGRRGKFRVVFDNPTLDMTVAALDVMPPPLDDQHPKQENEGAKQPRTIPVKSIDSVFKSCGRGGTSYLVQETWKNVGDRPIRTLYVNIRAYNKAGVLVHQVLDYPIYSVPKSAPGVAPGETYHPGPEEGYVIPIGTSSPDDPAKCTGGITRAAEEGIK